MSRATRSDAQEGAAGGLNLTGDPSRLQANQLRVATNVRLLADGGWQKRRGLRRLHASAIGSGAIVRGGFAWRKTAAQELLALSNGILHVGAYGLPITWTAKAGAFSSSTVPSFAAFRDGSGEVVYIADGGLLNKYDAAGSVTVNIASTGSPAVIVVYNQRLLGISGTDQTITWSALNNGDTLNIAGSLGGSAVVRTFGNQRLTGLAVVGSSLLMFHVTGISRFTGMTSDDISIDAGARGVSGSEGTIAAHSIQVIEMDGVDVAFFLTSRGLFAATEGGVSPVSRELEGVLAALDQSSWARVQSAHAKQSGEVRFYLPDVGVYAWNYRTKSWSGPDTGAFIPTHAMFGALDGQAREIVLTGGDDGFIRQAEYPGAYRDDVLSDGTGGDRFTMRAQCHRMFARDKTSRKSWRRAFVTCNLNGADSTQLRWTTRLDGSAQSTFATPGADESPAWGASGTEWGTTGPWGGVNSKPGTIPVRVQGKGEWIDLEIIDDSEAEPEFSEVSVEGDDLNRRTS